MSDLNLQLLPWQEEVMKDSARFKIVAAGRRTGKSHLAAISLILSALDGKDGKVFYVAPTQGQARDVIWHTIFDIANDIIERSHINNLEITLSGGNTIYLKGADRPDSLRGVSLKHLVLDEYAFMKPDVFESILRPALADRKGSLIAIGTPEGRNHFYDMFQGANGWDDWSQFHYTSFDNPLVDKAEIEHARSTLPAWAFAQEFMASFDARTVDFRHRQLPVPRRNGQGDRRLLHFHRPCGIQGAGPEEGKETRQQRYCRYKSDRRWASGMSRILYLVSGR